MENTFLHYKHQYSLSMKIFLKKIAGNFFVLINLFRFIIFIFRAMLERAQESGVELRGQTKTHKTVEGGILQTGGTKRKIVTSTLIEVVKGGCGGCVSLWFSFSIKKILFL